MLQVILGTFGVFLIFIKLVSQKRQVLERNIYLNLSVIQFYVVIVCHLVKQSAKAPGLLFCFSKVCIFYFLRFFFVFVNIGPYGINNFKRHLLWKDIAHSVPKIHTYVQGGSLPKLYKHWRNFKLWIFAIFFLFFFLFVNMGQYGRKKLQTTSFLKVHKRFAPKIQAYS